MNKLQAAWALSLASSLAACGGGAGSAGPTGAQPQTGSAASRSGLDQVPDAGPCDSIVAGGGRVEWIVDADCAGCAVADAPLAADGDLDSFATLTYAPGSRTGGAAIRATAAPGHVFDDSNAPYAVVDQPETALLFYTRLRTYLGGSPQDEFVGSLPAGTGASRQEYRLKPTKPYDAYEFYVRHGLTPETTVVRVYELCNNLNGEGP